jgi:hypothetical protein
MLTRLSPLPKLGVPLHAAWVKVVAQSDPQEVRVDIDEGKLPDSAQKRERSPADPAEGDGDDGGRGGHDDRDAKRRVDEGKVEHAQRLEPRPKGLKVHGEGGGRPLEGGSHLKGGSQAASARRGGGGAGVGALGASVEEEVAAQAKRDRARGDGGLHLDGGEHQIIDAWHDDQVATRTVEQSEVEALAPSGEGSARRASEGKLEGELPVTHPGQWCLALKVNLHALLKGVGATEQLHGRQTVVRRQLEGGRLARARDLTDRLWQPHTGEGGGIGGAGTRAREASKGGEGDVVR